MPTGPDLPSTAMLMQIAADHGLDLTTADAESYRALMAGAIESYLSWRRTPSRSRR